MAGKPEGPEGASGNNQGTKSCRGCPIRSHWVPFFSATFSCLRSVSSAATLNASRSYHEFKVSPPTCGLRKRALCARKYRDIKCFLISSKLFLGHSDATASEPYLSWMQILKTMPRKSASNGMRTRLGFCAFRNHTLCC